MSTRQTTNKIIYGLTTLSFEEFTSRFTVEEIIATCEFSIKHNGDGKSKGGYVYWGLPPLMIYALLLLERLKSEPESKLNKKINMLQTLGGDIDTKSIYEALYINSFSPLYLPEEIEANDLYQYMEFLTYEHASYLEDRIEADPTCLCAKSIQALYLGFIRQLEPNEYTVNDGIYEVLDMEHSLNRLLKALDFDMCLFDLYSVLLMKHYIKPWLASRSNIHAIRALYDTVIKVPLEEVSLYSREKQSYFEFNEELGQE